MSKNKKRNNTGERLFYTFGSIFMAAIITVCAINYKRDGRYAQTAFAQANTGASSVQPATVTIKIPEERGTTKSNTSKTTVKASSKETEEQSPALSAAVSPSTAQNNSSHSPSGSDSTAVQQTVTAQP